ncbi:MAG: SLC13 family permease [Gaiellales bacterium]
MELVTAAIFVVVLIAIVLDWIDRTKLALLGAAVMVLVGGIAVEPAIHAIDWATLGLLLGMMILIALSQRTGIFGWVGIHAARLSRGRPLRLLLLIGGLTALLSAFLDNLTAILLVLPIAFTVARILRMSPLPLVITQIVASNIGGTATLIGDPPNIMIAGHRPELGFVDFIVHLAPPAIIALAVALALLRVMFRRDLRFDRAHAATIASLDPSAELHGSRGRRVASILVLIGTLLAFLAHGPLGLAPVVVALCGATAMLLVADVDMEHALDGVEWPTLLFFIGLFVMIGALEQQGVISAVASAVEPLTAGSPTREAMVVIWAAALGSALVDNIPFTAAMLPVVDQIQGPELKPYLWWSLALGACFGGNATLVAAAANVAASGIAKREGHTISFTRFLLHGLPIALASLVIATGWTVFVLL